MSHLNTVYWPQSTHGNGRNGFSLRDWSGSENVLGAKRKGKFQRDRSRYKGGASGELGPIADWRGKSSARGGRFAIPIQILNSRASRNSSFDKDSASYSGRSSDSDGVASPGIDDSPDSLLNVALVSSSENAEFSSDPELLSTASNSAAMALVGIPRTTRHAWALSIKPPNPHALHAADIAVDRDSIVGRCCQ